ncbi:hypothetical protein [Candidatus Blastococcus massiliensis]|uniref:hypothetical protein n=1 Tax=Candidatus Blastococcus massiliensis TaxID=1470358 RepID=UPI0004B66D8B|nr:hypothetical protein [Candidatus Blastococcus massiliensis]
MTRGIAPEHAAADTDDEESRAEALEAPPEITVEDVRVDARLFTEHEVRHVARRISPSAALFIAVAVLAGATTGLVVWAFPSQAPPDYHGVSAGGLMALAGIVPAVLAAVATGRPVTRLDGGQIMLRGLSRWVVGCYAVAWLAAFLVPLFSLVTPWGWLGSPAGLGAGLGLLVLTTLMTPALFMVLAGRLHPRESTLLAVARASRPARRDPSPEDLRSRCALVKDLRDLARSEFQSGDRRAVRYRMAGLATIAARTDVHDVVELALDELGLVCQEVVLDRDLAREGVAVLSEAARSLPPAEFSLHRRAVHELIRVWSAVVRGGSSDTLRDETVDGIVAIAGLRGDEELPLLAMLLAEFAEDAEVPQDRLAAAMRSIERRVDFVHLPTGPAATAWARARGRLDPGGFTLLLARYTALTASGRVTDSARTIAEAAAALALSDAEEHRLRSKPLVTAVAAAVGSEHSKALLRAAVLAVWIGHPAADEARGVLLAETVRNLPRMDADDLDDLVDRVTQLPDDLLLDRCAPALIPALDAAVAPLLKPPGEDDAALHDARQRALVLLVTEIRTAAVMRDPRLADPLDGRIEELFARLVDGARTGALVSEPSEILRRRTAFLIHRVEALDAAAARTVAAPAVPLLLTAGGVFGPAWLLWSQEAGNRPLREQIPPEWVAGIVPALVTVRASMAAAGEDTPLGLPTADPHTVHGWTWGAAAETATDALPGLLSLLPAPALDQAMAALHRWVNQGPPADSGQDGVAARAAEALGMLPEVAADDARATLLAYHRTALELSLHGLWWLPGTVAEPDPARTTIAGEILSTATPRLLRASHNLALQVLEALVRTWWSGITAGHRVDPAALAAVRRAALARPPVRSFVEANLRAPGVPGEVLQRLLGLGGRSRPGGGQPHGGRGSAQQRPGGTTAGRRRQDRPASPELPRQRRPRPAEPADDGGAPPTPDPGGTRPAVES